VSGWMLERGPIGVWRPALGTAAALFGEEVVFREDGTGESRTSSAIFGPEVLPFQWHMLNRGEIWIRPDDEEARVVVMEFRRMATDVGEVTALVEAGQEAFWPSDHPLERLPD
jgi:hypothetical protein